MLAVALPPVSNRVRQGQPLKRRFIKMQITGQQLIDLLNGERLVAEKVKAKKFRYNDPIGPRPGGQSDSLAGQNKVNENVDYHYAGANVDYELSKTQMQQNRMMTNRTSNYQDYNANYANNYGIKSEKVRQSEEKKSENNIEYDLVYEYNNEDVKGDQVKEQSQEEFEFEWSGDDDDDDLISSGNDMTEVGIEDKVENSGNLKKKTKKKRKKKKKKHKKKN